MQSANLKPHAFAGILTTPHAGRKSFVEEGRFTAPVPFAKKIADNSGTKLATDLLT